MIDRTPRMTIDEYRATMGLQPPQPAAPRTQHDHCKAVRTQGADGSVMASKAEARRSHELDLLRAASEVVWWRPQGWRHWKIFTSERDSGQIGRGCE